MSDRKRLSLTCFASDIRGTVTIISAFVLPVLIGGVALVAEFGHGLIIKVENQRVADLSAYAGALAYNAAGTTGAMNTAISKVAALNGFASSAVAGTLVTSPSGSGNQAVSVTVETSKLLLLAPVLRSGSSLPVTSSAFAELAAPMGGCILALKGSGTGVTLSGGTTLTASSCVVASNAAVSVPCGTTITTKALTYNSAAAPSQPCSGIQPPSGTPSVKITKAATADPLSGDANVATARTRLATVAGYAAPTLGTIPTGTNVDFAYSTSTTQAAVAATGCAASLVSSTWTVTCPAGGTRNFGTITLGGGITVNFNTGGSASTIYNFSGAISNTGTALNFGPGTYNIKQGVTAGGGSTTTFGAGTFSIGAGAAACNGSGNYSICNTGTSMTFGGPSAFTITSGIYNTGGAILTLGSGTTNSYQIGPSSTGNGFFLAGGSKTKLADALGGTSLFKVVGDINVASGGGSCLALPAAVQHDILGFIGSAGGTILGSGTYTVTEYVALGAAGGGDVTCWGATVGMTGTNVTMVIGASATLLSGTCSGTAFCVGAGYGNVSLTAPASGALAKLAVIGPASGTAGVVFAEGASNTSLSGAFYVPNGPISISGGSSVGNGTGQCLQFIGSQVSIAGGGALASRCVGASASAQAVVLVQ